MDLGRQRLGFFKGKKRGGYQSYCHILEFGELEADLAHTSSIHAIGKMSRNSYRVQRADGERQPFRQIAVG